MSKYTFWLNDKEEETADKWMKKQSLELAASQAKMPDLVEKHPYILQGIPYTGAIGGLFEFKFAETSLGSIIRIRNTVTEEQLDITDYDSW